MRPVDTGLNEEQKISQLSNFIDLILVRKWAIICHANLCNFECQIVNVKFINPNVCFWFFILRPVCNSHLSWAEFLLLLFFYPPTYREVSKHDMKKTLNLALWGARCDQRALFVTISWQAMPVYSNGDQWLPGGAICDQCDQKRPVTGRCFQYRFWAKSFSL